MAFLRDNFNVHRGWRTRGFRLVGLLACMGLPALAADIPEAENQLRENQVKAEYQVKAELLFRWGQFVAWPSRAFPNAQAPIVVGILGDNPFGPLDEFLKESGSARPLAVRYYRTIEEVKDCHILFVSRSEAPRFEAIMGQLKGRPILTVGDVESFTRAGGMVRFDMESGKVRLRVNFDEAKASGVTISSKVGRFATIVTKEKG